MDAPLFSYIQQGFIYVTEVVTPALAWLIFGALMLIYAVFTWIFAYHWRNYSIDYSRIRKTWKLYFGASSVLIVAMVVSLILYS